MVLFKFRAWPQGPNLISAAVYNVRGWHTLILFLGADRTAAARLPVRVRLYR